MKSPLASPRVNRFLAGRGVTPRYIANFDSTSTMLYAIAKFLHGQDFPGVGIQPSAVAPLVAIFNALPTRLRRALYSLGGWSEAMSARHLDKVRMEYAERWAINQYPRRRYPAVMIGSSNGALVHLCAALGIPWLPQTFLIPLRRAYFDPDEPQQDLMWAREPAQRLLLHNPDVRIYQMHDPNQDRLMLRRMSYFRVKRLKLGSAYEEFLERALAPGGTIFIAECRLAWPATSVSDRHIFQFGGKGGLRPAEYFEGSSRVAEFLRRQGSSYQCWQPPAPDGRRPEAEWGFDAELLADLERLARRRGYRLCRFIFDDPEDFSPLVADLYRWWYAQRGIVASRLLIESFVYLEPWWVLRTGSTPFWTVFSVEPSVQRVERYLARGAGFDEIYAMLFSHGIRSAGIAGIEHWRRIIERARKAGGFIGVDEEKFPGDLKSFVRYHTRLKELPARYPLPGPLPLSQLEHFLAESGARYNVDWVEGTLSDASSAA